MTVEVLKPIEMLVKRKWNYEDAGVGGGGTWEATVVQNESFNDVIEEEISILLWKQKEYSLVQSW